MADKVSNIDSVHTTAGQFPSTLWSVVLLASDKPSAGSREALASLCRAYWHPLYAFLRRQGKSPHDAQDLTQAFFVHLLNRDRLGQVHPSRGRFRSFLLAALKNFLVDEWDKAHAQKRGGGVELISLDARAAEEQYAIEPVDGSDPEKLFERRWALTVLERVLDRVESEYTSRGHQQRFAALQRFLLGEDASASYAEIAAQLGMTEPAVKMAVMRLRQRAREIFRDEVASTVATEREVDEEVRSLSAILSG